MCIGKLDGSMRYINKSFFLSFAFMVAGIVFASPAAHAQNSSNDAVKIYTDTYRPYVAAAGEVDGSAMRLVRMVVRNMGLTPEFEHIDYGFGYYTTQKSMGDLSFPWLKTEAREKEVLYSKPLYTSDIEYYYNIRFQPNGLTKSDLTGKVFGRVINYSYGPDIDSMLESAEEKGNAKTFATDIEAIRGLLNGDVDILPQLSAVLMATLDNSFPNQNRLVRSIPEIKTPFPNYLIAPKTAKGRALIKAFNQSYDELIAAGVIDPENLSVASPNSIPNDIAQIVASEGFPVIIGVSNENAKQSFAIPPGTKVLILDWSERIKAPSDADQLYKTMVDETLVLILNGPHIGKELRIKNMHLTIAP